MSKKKNKQNVPNGIVKDGIVKNGKIMNESTANNNLKGKAIITDPMAVTWMEKYSEQVDRVWSKLPKFVANTIVTIAIFMLGITVNGQWIHMGVHVAKQLGYNLGYNNETNLIGNTTNSTTNWSEVTLESLYLKDILFYWIGACTVGYVLFYGIGGFLHWYYYVNRRHRAEEWKCQPYKWLTPELERHEIFWGSLSLSLTSTTSAFLACFIANGGPTCVYYTILDYPLWWFFLQFPVVFIYQDYLTYWMHRIYHTPFLYKHFHKLHHTYKQPTVFSVTAIHPVEILNIQLVDCLPLFLVPLHWSSFCVVALYTYYHGIIDHSGVNFKSHWWQPWQPDAIFHDNHHQYFHVNFAFNISIWDKIHGTYRRKDRVYTEDIYYGRGKALEEVSAKELQQDLEERRSENPLAFRGNKLEFALSKKEIAEKTKKQKKTKEGKLIKSK